ncbi:hypothetical protein ACED51_01710 [Photobacterium swingsii]|uniref:DUF7402 domain-containing protein n=1 Tax=Photobacterium swingsii TaxID=680026 RepID=UPI00352E54FE
MKKNKTLHYLLLVITSLYSTSIIASNLNVYVSAHADDWQLFMNPNAYKDINALNSKVLFIYFTAGDSGLSNLPIGNPKYIARKEGASKAVKFLVNTNNGNYGLSENVSVVNFNDHNFNRREYKNTVSYYFDLPDGNMNGQGFKGNNYNSLEKLRTNKINTIRSVNNKLQFKSWEDLTKTVELMIDFETQDFDNVIINASETNHRFGNLGDHSDHQNTSLIFQEINNKNNKCYSFNFYNNYQTKNSPPNLDNNDIIINAGTWGVTTATIAENKTASSWDFGHNKWLSRMYFRSVKKNKNCQTNLNLALSAKVTASSENNSNNQVSKNIIDGIYSGYPGKIDAEWASNNEKVNAWIKLNWDEAIIASKVNIFDRPNKFDNITEASLIIGSSEKQSKFKFSEFKNGMAYVKFPKQKITYVKVVIDKVSEDTSSVGLSEVEIY